MIITNDNFTMGKNVFVFISFLDIEITDVFENYIIERRACPWYVVCIMAADVMGTPDVMETQRAMASAGMVLTQVAWTIVLPS